MSCVVTEKIDFEVAPPRVTVESPGVLTNRKAVSDFGCNQPGMSFQARFYNEQFHDPLYARVIVNGRVFRGAEEVRSDGPNGTYQFCLPFDQWLGGMGEEGPATTCYEVNLYVSHSFTGFTPEDPATPAAEGDVDSVVWYVGVRGTADTASLWEACRSLAELPAPEPTASPDGQQEGGAQP